MTPLPGPPPIHRGPRVGDFDAFRASLIEPARELHLRMTPPPHLPMMVFPPDKLWMPPAEALKISVISRYRAFIESSSHCR